MEKPIPIDSEIQYLKGIGEKRAELFASLGIYTVDDLLYYFPRSYEDLSDVTDIAKAPPGQKVLIRVRVLSDMTARITKTGKTLYGTLGRDSSAFIGIKYYNNKFVRYTVKENADIYLYGKVTVNNDGAYEITGAEYEPADNFTPGIRAIYPQTAGLNSKQINKAVATAFVGVSQFITETLPDEQLKKYRLISLRDALKKIHFPHSSEDITAARRRLIYEELLTLQLGLLLRGKGEKGSTHCVINKDYTEDYLKLIPYALTGAQKRSISECIADMSRKTPMRRLLQGDVGSGKTAVAAGLMFTAVKNGYQTALMAPTEVLAEQHYENFRKMFADTGINCGLLTGSMSAKQKREIRKKTADGEIDMLIGTHAVITDDTLFKNAGLMITDEQHRFGVMQRAALREKGNSPHVLVMSATPIPRTLSLIIYGDLDISVLDEKPAGRIPVKTFRVDSSYSERMYGFVRKESQAGRKTFIVCPRIEQEAEEQEENGRKAAENYAEELRNGALKGLEIGLLHGKMKQKEKNAVMAEFAEGNMNVLVCTTVIEVGIDVPSASTIIIENAENFGMAQLHQLRGRVGRGKDKSYCILVSDAVSEEANSRLDTMCKSSDGFFIAEEDLRHRGPGDFFGSRQSGLPEMHLADLMTDSKILYAARTEAENILAADPELISPSYRILKRKTDEMFTDIS